MIKKNIIKLIDYFFPSFLYSQKTYSQDGEDMLISSFYEGRKKYKGFYIDIGAHHPYRFSNTAYFYKKGWRGINIEPTPNLIKAFKRFRKRDINLNIGISDTNSKITFYEFNEPALNSFDKELSLYRHNYKGHNYRIIDKKEIQVFTLSNVLEKYLPKNIHIDFMTIDVEGLDLKVLESNDWTKYVPEFILVEGVFDVDNLKSDRIYTYLVDKGYILVGRTRRTFLFKKQE